jgi:hypothetical protein
MTPGENKNYDVSKSYPGCFITITNADYAHKIQFKDILNYSDFVLLENQKLLGNLMTNFRHPLEWILMRFSSV